MRCDLFNGTDGDDHPSDETVVDHLLSLAGDYLRDVPRVAPRVRRVWPLAEWQTCGGFGLGYSFRTGPTAVKGANAVAAPSGLGGLRKGQR